MSNPPAVSSSLSIASPPQPLFPHEDRGDKTPQQKAGPSTPSTWRRKQAVLVLVFVLVPLLLMSDGSAKNSNEKHSSRPGLLVSRVEGHGDTTPPPTPIQRSSHPSDSSIRIQSQGSPKSTHPPLVEEFTQRTGKSTINRKPREKSPSIRFDMFPKASRCNCRYEEQPDARRHTFKEALSKFMYGRNDTASSSSPTTSVQQRRVLVVGDSVGRYLAAGIVNGVIEESALDRDVLESLNLAAEQTKMKGGVATNLRRTRGTIAQWPPPEMLAMMSPAMVDKLPFRLQFEMDIFVSQDRNFTATRNMFDPTHIILARGNWDLDKMTPSNPRRYYNEFQGLLAAVRRAFPETHMFVYGFHKLNPGTSFLKKHPHVRCTHNKEIAIFREANYCAVKRYNGLLPPGHRAVHYIDSFGITKGFRKSNQENKDGLHYIGAALAALAHSTVEMMLLAAEQQVVGLASVATMNATEVQQCTIAVKDEFHTSRMPCQTPPSWLNETVQTAFELSQEVIFAGKHMHRIAATISCGGAGKTSHNNHTSCLFPVECPALITTDDINAVRTKKTLSPAIKAVSLAASSCSKLLVWLKEEFSGVQHLQRLVADAKRSKNEDGLPWTLMMLSDPTHLQEWLRNNAGNIVLNQRSDASGSSPPSPLPNNSSASPILNTKEFVNSHSVIDVAAQCVTMLHTHVTPAFFQEVLWPLSYGSGMVPCGAVRFLPFFQEWLSTPSSAVNNGEDDTHATQYSTVVASPPYDKSNATSPLLPVSSPLTSLSSASSTSSVSSQRHTARLLPFTEVDQHCHPGSIAWHEKAFGAARNTAVAMLQQEQRQVLLRSKEEKRKQGGNEKSVIASLEDAGVSATIFLRHCPDLLQSVHESLLSNRTKAGLHPSVGPPFAYQGKSSFVFFSFHEALDQFPVSPLIEDLEQEVLGTSVNRCVAALTKIVKHPQQTILNNIRPTNSHTRVDDPPKTKGLCAQLKKLQGLVASLHPVFLPSVTAKDVARLLDVARCPT